MYDDSEPQRFGTDDIPSREYYSAFHTSSKELAKIAAQAQPKLLVLYHEMGAGKPVIDGIMLDVLRAAGYKGAAVSAHDLDVY
jgi:ribonuclease Z